MIAFKAPPGLGNPHLQTMFSSVLRKRFLTRELQPFIAAGVSRKLAVDGQKLVAINHLRPEPSPIVAIIPGWLGSADSGYVIGFAHALWQAGYSVTRLTLRDHGDSARDNESMFNSALTDEVVAFVDAAVEGHSAVGVLGFSLGGNFALRVNRARPEYQTLAICPAIDPHQTMQKIDGNVIYQRYFLNKWRDIWRHKADAYPHRYRYSDIANLNSIATLTEHFIRQQTDFHSLDSYFAAYDLSGDRLKGVKAQVLASQDDPIIPFSAFAQLPESVTVEVTEQGGHGAYLEDWSMGSWLDGYAVRYFQQFLPV